MKNLFLASTILAGLAFGVAAPAAAQDGGVKLGISGYMAGYAVYTDEASNNTRSFDFRKATEIALSGETTLENGLTVGAFINTLKDRADSFARPIDESYLYFSGNWGRVNFGETDGAAFLLQVAAPSADDAVDGLDPDINTFDNTSGLTTGYAHVFDSRTTTKVVYMTPVFNGFQAAASYAASLSDADISGTAAATTDNDGGFGTAYEVAARYQGSFQPMDLTLGGGYSKAERELSGSTDQKIWNVGGVVTVGNINVGSAYKHDNTGTANDDHTTWVVGADYQLGATKLGLSYQDYTQKVTGTDDLNAQRYTGGAIYDFGPGMSFRGSVSYVDRDNGVNPDNDATQVAVGTVVNF